MTSKEVINYLTYSCYRYNRDRSPEITPQQWSVVFGPTEELEKLYQKDKLARKENPTNSRERKRRVEC